MIVITSHQEQLLHLNNSLSRERDRLSYLKSFQEKNKKYPEGQKSWEKHFTLQIGKIAALQEAIEVAKAFSNHKETTEQDDFLTVVVADEASTEVFPDSLFDNDTSEQKVLEEIVEQLGKIDDYRNQSPEISSHHVVITSFFNNDYEFHICPKIVALSSPELAHIDGYQVTVWKLDSVWGDRCIGNLEMVDLMYALSVAETMVVQYIRKINTVS